MEETYYKVLDVREHTAIGNGLLISGGINRGTIHMPQSQHVVVIALNTTTNERVRLEFFEPFKMTFNNKVQYHGHMGDYNVLIPGDYFCIKETDQWPQVKLQG